MSGIIGWDVYATSGGTGPGAYIGRMRDFTSIALAQLLFGEVAIRTVRHRPAVLHNGRKTTARRRKR
jgi:hypothetical protein